MTKEKGNSTALIAGILFAILAALRIFPVHFSIINILWIIGIAVTSYSLIAKRRDIVLCAGFAVFAILSLRSAVLVHSNSSIFSWLDTLAFISATLICIAEFTDYIPQLKDVGKKVWFVPAILIGLSIFQLFSPRYFIFMNFLESILLTVAVFLSMMWVVYPNGLPNTSKLARNNAENNSNTHNATNNFGNSTSAFVTDDLYYSLAKHILLLLFTFGIWFFIWIYRVTGYTNCVKDEEERNPTSKLLLCLFVPFYLIYWTYKTAQRIDKMAMAKGLQSDLSTLCLILAIFVPIIPPILMQDKLNTIATANNAKATPSQKPQMVDSVTLGTAEELKTYKELLDQGVITQEEFDAKKKQLLGL